MEDIEDFEVIRLKKLLEENILQVEKENMAILQSSSKTQENLSNSVRRDVKTSPIVKAAPPVKQTKSMFQSSSKTQQNISNSVRRNAKTCPIVKAAPPAKQTGKSLLQSSSKTQEILSNSVRRNVKTCPIVEAAPPAKQNGLDINSRDAHSRIHFLNELQSTLLPMSNQRRILINDAKNRYIPCAIPLSPPVRLKREESNENVYSAYNTIQNYIPEDPLPGHTYNKPKLKHTCNQSSPVHTCNKSSPVPVHTCNKSSKKDCAIQNYIPEDPLPDHTCNKPKLEHTCNRFSPVHMCNKPSKKDFTVIEKFFPPTSNYNERGSFPSLSARKETRVKDASQNTSFAHNDQHFPNFKNVNSNLSRKTLNPEDQNFKSKEDEFSVQGNDKKCGLHFEIALDSCSTKDIINKALHKIPEFIDKLRASSSSDDIPTNSCSTTNQREKMVQDSLTSVSGSHNIPEPKRVHQEQKQTVSACTQTVFENFKNVPECIKISENQTQIASSSAQTDQNNPEFPIDRHELHHLVREIVLETLQAHEHHSVDSKRSPKCQKVDSGIQSDVDYDGTDFNRQRIEIPNKDHLDQRNIMPIRDSFSLSKGIQVDSVQVSHEKNVCNKSCNTEKPQISLAASSLRDCYATSSTGSSERNESPVRTSENKIQFMLEKIYGHICEDKEVQNNFSDIPLHTSILTRDVAVQFNPLHTCTKSTLTSEIKKVDSSSQYDIELKTNIKSNIDASVQVECLMEPCDKQHLQLNAYTQCEKKSFIDSVVQTEFFNPEYSAANTSVSSTPVSDRDGMYMDDNLSEGEVPLHLSLLSFLGGNMNLTNMNSTNTDSSITDNSIKEKDSSLSEGEIPPAKVAQCLQMYYYRQLAENGSYHDHDIYPTKLVDHAKIQHATSSDIDKPGQSTGKNLRWPISSSPLSESECSSGASFLLSPGEIPPHSRVPFSDPSVKADNNPSIKGDCTGDKSQYDHLPSSSSAENGKTYRNLHSPSFFESEQHRGDEQNAFQSVLQPVDEVHSIYD